MNMDRSWMYKRFEGGYLNPTFVEGVENFIEYATNQQRWKDGAKIKCPCNLIKCRNRRFLDVETVKFHLAKYGFVSNYFVWTFQGETNPIPTENQNIEVEGSSFVGKGESYVDYESAYYGRLLEVVRLEYPGLPIKQVVLFNCEWFDPTSTDTKVDPYYKLVEINHKRRFNRYEPFILATQATQVYYCTYPSLKRDKVDWWAVCKVKARSTVQFIEESISASFQEETIDTPASVHVDNDQISLNDVNNELVELEDELNSSDEMHETNEDEFDSNEETYDESDDVGIGDTENDSTGKGTRGLRQNQGRHQERNQGSGIRPSEPEPPSTPQDYNDVDDFTNDTPSSPRETPTLPKFKKVVFFQLFL
ncbi:hypothetical protein OROMI_005955 [Orobanche minor]